MYKIHYKMFKSDIKQRMKTLIVTATFNLAIVLKSEVLLFKWQTCTINKAKITPKPKTIKSFLLVNWQKESQT